MTSNPALRVAVIQQSAWPEKAKSLTESERLLAHLQTEKPTDLVLLQELHCTHYFCQTEDVSLFDLAEPLDGPSAQRLSRWAKQYQCVLVGSIFEKRAAGIFSSIAFIVK